MIGLMGVSQMVKAQEYNCDEAYIIFNDGLRSKDYERAYEFWQILVNGTCDAKLKEKMTIITNGGAVVGKMVKTAATPEQKKLRMDSLYFNYTKGIEVHGRVPELVEAFGSTYARYESKTKTQETHDLLKESITALQEKSKAKSIQYYFTACFYLFNEKKMDKGGMIENYLWLMELCEKAAISKELTEKSTGKWNSIATWLPEIGDKFLNCQAITETYKPKVEEDPTNMELLKKVFELLDRKKCENQDVSVEFYLDVLTKMLAIEPTAEGYFGLANLHYAKGDKSKAGEFAQKAYDLAGDNVELKRKIIKIGVNCSQSKWYPIWASDFPKDGEPWLDKASDAANQVSNTKLDPNLTMRKLAYSRAIDLAKKAKSLDPSVTGKADSMIAQYRERLPACDELFQLGISNGDKVTLGSLGTVTVDCN
jgi:tetratricopeptide (TPR) repeat protein